MERGAHQVRELVQSGADVVLVSQALDHIMVPLAQHLGVKRIVANRLEFRDGIATGRYDLLRALSYDRLHEPYRAENAPLLKAIHSDPPMGAAGVTLSGSGPTVIVWARKERVDEVVAELAERFPEHEVMPLSIATSGAGPV